MFLAKVQHNFDIVGLDEISYVASLCGELLSNFGVELSRKVGHAAARLPGDASALFPPVSYFLL